MPPPASFIRNGQSCRAGIAECCSPRGAAKSKIDCLVPLNCTVINDRDVDGLIRRVRIGKADGLTNTV